ncbi:hypothetical protein [Kitasatospora purpeofusca]|uniref:hypothetical protein n=1 Tax=Kitasatospora purpeofusca TaxID=67352 RepID=UPI002A5A7EA1|nr:hypothetical protein [Kitasatospora purpeofusca]MDY0810294.1 hypothetical protein [Kitasatospora purpeofusca]
MTRSTKYAAPAVALAFLLVPLGLVALRAVLVESAPPSPVGRWSGLGADGTRLELVEGGRPAGGNGRVPFDAPRRCSLTLTSSVTDGEGHQLAVSLRTDHRTWWTLAQP